MTQHRLVHCALHDLVELAERRHPGTIAPGVRLGGPRWFTHGRPPGGAAICWTARLPGPQHVDTVWWLEIEPGATGVLAHLTAEAVSVTWPVPPPVSLAIRAWSGRELATLARVAETGVDAA